jgi:hypothetical protein
LFVPLKMNDTAFYLLPGSERAWRAMTDPFPGRICPIDVDKAPATH